MSVTATDDFNPIADDWRVIGSNGISLRANKVTKGGNHKYADADMHKGEKPNFIVGAYTNSVKGTKQAASFNIDGMIGALVKQAPPNDVLQIMSPTEAPKVFAAVLTALVRVHHHHPFGLSAPHSHEQCVQGQFSVEAGIHRRLQPCGHTGPPPPPKAPSIRHAVYRKNAISHLRGRRISKYGVEQGWLAVPLQNSRVRGSGKNLIR